MGQVVITDGLQVSEGGGFPLRAEDFAEYAGPIKLMRGGGRLADADQVGMIIALDLVNAGHSHGAIVRHDAAVMRANLTQEILLEKVMPGEMQSVLFAPVADRLRIRLVKLAQYKAVEAQADGTRARAVKEPVWHIRPEIAPEPLSIPRGQAIIPGDASGHRITELMHGRLVGEDAGHASAKITARLARKCLMG
ncbi:MAG: hypothetical protein BWY76_01691 [bacterium ADurb.Bin429]|nr:MAG: hypothetical protein BWY76_01691 [bacterium ADurb.Bin429]